MINTANALRFVGAIRFAVLGLVLASAPGCTYTFAARLYDMQSGGVATATFKWNGSGHGVVEIALPSGELCKGEYVTISDDVTTWGSIFATGSAGGGIASGYGLTTQGKQKGSAVAVGDRGTTVECEYVTSASSPQGYGTCRDNHQKSYKLMFGRAAGAP